MTDLFGHPTTKAQRKRDRVQAAVDWELSMLRQWMEREGYSMEQFIADVERLQPGTKPTDFMGIHPEIALKVSLDYGHYRVPIVRGMQHLAITRPWRRAPLA